MTTRTWVGRFCVVDGRVEEEGPWLGSLVRQRPDEDADALARDVLAVTLAGLRSGLPLRSSSAPRVLDDQPQESAHDAHVS